MFYKKSRAKVGNKYKWFPRVSTRGKGVGTQYIAQMSTASLGDVYLVLRALPDTLSFFMNAGQSVHIEGLGSFHAVPARTAGTGQAQATSAGAGCGAGGAGRPFGKYE